MSYQRHYVSVSNGELAVGVWGKPGARMTVLAPHGITANHSCWQPLADLLPDAQIIAPDLRGRGRSNELGEPYGLMQHARDLEQTLDFFGVDKAIVVGHSMGGFVAVRFAANFAKRVSAVVLVDGGLPLKRPDGVATEDLVSETLGPAADRLARVFETRDEYQEFWKAHPAFSHNFNKYVSKYVDYDLHEVVNGFQPSGNLDAVQADISELFGDDEYLQELQSIQVPTVFIRAPRGLLDDQPLYSEDLTQHHSQLVSQLGVLKLDDFNHYTIVLSEKGSRVIAEQVMELSKNSKLSQETR